LAKLVEVTEIILGLKVGLQPYSRLKNALARPAAVAFLQDNNCTQD